MIGNQQAIVLGVYWKKIPTYGLMRFLPGVPTRSRTGRFLHGSRKALSGRSLRDSILPILMTHRKKLFVAIFLKYSPCYIRELCYLTGIPGYLPLQEELPEPEVRHMILIAVGKLLEISHFLRVISPIISKEPNLNWMWPGKSLNPISLYLPEMRIHSTFLEPIIWHRILNSCRNYPVPLRSFFRF